MAGEFISVSEDKLNGALAGLELRIVDRITAALEAKADQGVVEGLGSRITAAEITLASTQWLIPTANENRKRIGALERWRWKTTGLAIAASFFVSTIATASWHIWG